MALPVPREPQPLPATLSRALVVLWNPDATADHFSRVIESDPRAHRGRAARRQLRELRAAEPDLDPP